MNFRNYLTGTIFGILLIWGPIDHTSSLGFLFRTLQLILIPLVVWLLLALIWYYWQPTKKLEITLERILSGIISIALFILAFFEAISETHIGNTQQIRTNDGLEDVGEYVVIQGANWSHVITLVIIASLVLWIGVLKKEGTLKNGNGRN